MPIFFIDKCPSVMLVAMNCPALPINRYSAWIMRQVESQAVGIKNKRVGHAQQIAADNFAEFMVAPQIDYPASQPFQPPGNATRTPAVRHIADEKYEAVFFDGPAPVSQDAEIHLFDIAEGTVAIADDVRMIEVCVGDKERSSYIVFVQIIINY